MTFEKCVSKDFETIDASVKDFQEHDTSMTLFGVGMVHVRKPTQQGASQN